MALVNETNCPSKINESIAICYGILEGKNISWTQWTDVCAEFICKHAAPECYSITRETMPECSGMEQAAFRYLFPLLLLLCLIGNILNLFIYRLPYFEDSTAVHLLRFKTVANVGFLLFLCPNMLYYWQDPGKPVHEIERAFWFSRPYILVFVGFFGALTAWSTLLITLETVVCITNPMTFRLMNKSRYTTFSLVSFCLFAFLLQMTPAVAWRSDSHIRINKVEKGNGTEFVCEKSYRNERKLGQNYEIYEKLYYWIHVLLVILIPIALMILSSVFLIFRFRDKGLGSAFSERRRCVIRITTLTTLSHVILEGPAVATIYFGGITGSKYEDYSGSCTLTLVTNFMAAANAAVPFYLYFMCNANFRRMTKSVLSPFLGTVPDPVDAGQVRRERFKSCAADDLTGLRAFRRARLYSGNTLISRTREGRGKSFHLQPSFTDGNHTLVKLSLNMAKIKRRDGKQTIV